MTTIAHDSLVNLRNSKASSKTKCALPLAAAVLIAFVTAASLHYWFGPIGYASSDQTTQDWHGNWSVSSRQ